MSSSDRKAGGQWIEIHFTQSGRKNNFDMVNNPLRLATFTELNWIVCVRAGDSIFIPLPFINWS